MINKAERAARLSQASYSVDTQWLRVTKLESVFKKLSTSLASVVKPATFRAAWQLRGQRDGATPVRCTHSTVPM